MQILKEFEDEFKDINANSLLDDWESYAKQFRGILRDDYQIEAFESDWAVEIEDFLVLLKLMPSKQIGRNIIASESTLKNATSKLLQFVKVKIIVQLFLCICFKTNFDFR